MYTIKSVKATTEVDGTRAEVIAAAIAHEQEYQPPFGVEVLDERGGARRRNPRRRAGLGAVV